MLAGRAVPPAVEQGREAGAQKLVVHLQGRSRYGIHRTVASSPRLRSAAKIAARAHDPRPPGVGSRGETARLLEAAGRRGARLAPTVTSRGPALPQFARGVRDCSRTRGQPRLPGCAPLGSFLCSSSVCRSPVPTMLAATVAPEVVVAAVPVVRRAVLRQALVVQQAVVRRAAVASGARRAAVVRLAPVAAVQAAPPVAKACVHARSFAPAVPAQHA